MVLFISVILLPAVVALGVQLFCYQQHKQATERKLIRRCGQAADQLC